MSVPDRCADAPSGRSGVMLPVRWFPDFKVWSRSYASRLHPAQGCVHFPLVGACGSLLGIPARALTGDLRTGNRS